MKKTVILALACGCVGLLMTSAARADDAYITTSFSDMQFQQFTHNDLTPFKGNAFVTATNTGDQPWGDFHFQIFDPSGGTMNIANVSFLDATTTPPGPNPSSSQVPFTWMIDNVSVGARMDLFFYGAPVLPGQTATFTVYTDNPDHLSFFGLMIWPTPVPEPASILLLGFAALLIRRR
jgi:hypothetical protein